MDLYDLIIIGAGPAGITAGIYAARKKIKTLLITKDFTGQVGLSWKIENYPGFKQISGLKLMENLKNHLKEYEIEIKNFEEVKQIVKDNNYFQTITNENKYLARTLIIATGALPKKLAIKNEKKFLGHGLSYCLTCDEKAFEGKIVAVIGGGNAGAEAALELQKFCPKIYLLEYLENLTGDEILKEEVLNSPSITVITNAQVLSFEGEKELEKIIFKDRKTNKEKEILINGCFVEIGTKSNTEFLEGLVELNEKKEIIVDPKTMVTSVKGIFAAGDVGNFNQKQIILACGQGALAALSAYQYLKTLK
ncbi:MAG: FAD-dependent oxidoreductase [Parcubacteria group bacterium]|nr:FAD-dependent oxidoreductase [Parcubacteria group bacterium]